MNSSEKRRGGGGAHLLRAGPSHSTRHSNPASGGGGGGAAGATGGVLTTSNSSNSGSNSNSNSSNMPVLPPRAAIPSINSSSTDDHHEGGSSAGRAQSTDRKDKDKERESHRDNVSANSSTKAGASPRSKEKQRGRDTVLLREKDERIAYLEKEMGIMEREFQKELDKLSQNESETATFWQNKHSTLNQQYLRTDTELRLLRNEVEVRQAEREELRQGWELLQRELRERDDEIRRLRSQVRGLKEFVSTSTRSDDQTSDEVFGDGMTRLGNSLQNWVITNFRKAKLDVSRLDEATLAELSELVPMYEELVHTAKVHLLQSIVSRILVEMVFNSYYVGLSQEQTKNLKQMEQLLSSFCSSDEPVNQWRSSTLALLRREATHLHDDTDTFAEDVIQRINRLLDSITTGSGVSRSDARDSALRVIIKNSVELARRLVVQKAVLRVYMPTILPHQRVMFETDTMEDMGGEDEDALASREICCVVFPGVVKHGDENGGQMQFRNVIAKARVLCSPED